MSFYQQHVFFCTNVKPQGKKCCSQVDSQAAAERLKVLLSEAKCLGPEKIRVSASGCLGRCQQGPCVVVYPEGQWYTFNEESDINLLGECLISDTLSEYPKKIDVE